MTPLAIILHVASFLGLFTLIVGCYLDTRARLHRLEKWRLEQRRTDRGAAKFGEVTL